MKSIITLVGMVVLLTLMYLMSSNKKEVQPKIVIKAMIAQIIIAVLLIKFPYGRIVVSKVSAVVTQVLNYGINGLSFVFGSLANPGAVTGFVFMVVV